MKKHIFGFARVAIPALALAFVMGCSQGFESDTLSGGGLAGGFSASVQKGVEQPADLAGTDWLITTGIGMEPYFIVVNFSDDENGNLLGSDISRTTFSYTYEPNDGTGEITTLVGTGDFEIDTSDVMTITIPGYANQFTASLIVPTLDTMTGSVWNGPTPRYSYNSLDFEDSAVQTTFGDGTYPLYNLIYYDGVSAGLIEDMGLFYLKFDSAGVLTVVFPDFYRYHMSTPVVYTPSAPLLKSLNGTVWSATGSIKETVTFTADGADFSGDDPFNAKYVYNERQAGGVSNGAGSFRILAGSTLSIEFYNFRGQGDVIFTQQ
ncbi:MAG: hypothetical protein LBK83_12185 [Treponema sp.]|jgi:hypothetical protein|nr:hypothetical protein [Treponema sp.]